MEEQNLKQFNQLVLEVIEKYDSILEKHEKQSLLSILDKLSLSTECHQSVTLDYVFEKAREHISEFKDVQPPSKHEFEDIVTSFFLNPLFKTSMSNISNAIINGDDMTEVFKNMMTNFTNQLNQPNTDHNVVHNNK